MAVSKALTTQYLKRLYPDKVRMLMGEKSGKLLAMMKRNPKGFGESYDVGVEYGRLVSSGADFTKTQALASSGAPAGKKFAVTEVTHYTMARITGNIVRKANSSGNDGIFKEVLTVKSKKAFNTEIHRASRAVYEAGYGIVGVIGASGITTDTITLADKEDAVNFDIGMVVFLVANTGESAASRNSGTTITVLAVDRSAGTVQFTAGVVATIGAAADGDFIVVDGDRGTGATPTKLVMSGVKAWIPASVAATGDSHFGVDRASDPTRLAGWRVAGLGKSIRESFIDASYLVQNDADVFSHIFTHPANFASLAKELEGSKLFTAADFKTKAGIGIRGAMLQAEEIGEVAIIPDRYCPKKKSFCLDMETWELRSEGTWPQFMTFGDQGDLMTVDAADQAEVRVGGDLNVVCHAPMNNCIINHDL